MPVSPNDAANLGKQLIELYASAEETVLRRLARALADGPADAPDWADRKLGQLQQLRAQTQRQIVDLAEQAGEDAVDAVTTAYNRGTARAGTDLARIGTDDAIAFGIVDEPRMRALAGDLSRTLEGTHVRVLRWQDDVYRRAVADGVSQAATGTMTRREAAARTLDRFAGQGVTGFVDGAGRSWDLASYTEMATRTGLGRATVEGHSDRLRQSGHDLVIVSEHAEECPVCAPWEGRVLSLSGDGEHPSLADAEADGLFHANCRHTATLYHPSLVDEGRRQPEDPEGYEQRQTQRYQERKIREWKRREAAAVDDRQAEKARGKVREWQARQRQFTEETGRRRNYPREQLGAR